jgi:hypothetical protein
MNEITRLHNSPPDPIDEALSPYDDTITEAEGWLDGSPVENEGQMKAVDALLKNIKAAKKAVEGAQDSEAKPIYDAWKAARARFEPTITDLDRIAKGLIAAVDVFKRKLAAEKEAARKAAEAAAWEATRKAQEAARQAAASDLEAQRAAAVAQDEAERAQRASSAANKDTVKGLRTVTRYEVTDHRALLNYIAQNHRAHVTEWIEAWARDNHKAHPDAPGLHVWQDKVAF